MQMYNCVGTDQCVSTYEANLSKMETQTSPVGRSQRRLSTRESDMRDVLVEPVHTSFNHPLDAMHPSGHPSLSSLTGTSSHELGHDLRVQ